mmetsp:Transcript_5488/g.7419  ORF Transcript_5488/g.7419 Transcript_5488/m.7419 type:complete len:99 (-) Transcript_5488:190-486(-)|eukprot:CAMPEP_0196579634 /NCGR_PEP_ID=MMETSP1081-20130531/23820_1 /TAXON_ID=36882 /ORGANISM="Pyramimonas amylifera, Strain CCMP720" /LENGTH=98 /DNA_ID=CAMNT_0041899273 /DNA_START=182 /DNA_END=478 /DNA_ORIENTATION=+
MTTKTPDVKPEKKMEAITISVQSQTSEGNLLQFKVKKTTKFEKVFTAFCTSEKLDIHHIKFIYDGNRLRSHQSPQDFEMEDGDIIDAFVEQTGGFMRN